MSEEPKHIFETARPPPEPTAEEARRYIEIFAKHTMPGTQYVDTKSRRIYFNNMTDDDAIFVAKDLQRIEAEAYEKAKPHAS